MFKSHAIVIGAITLLGSLHATAQTSTWASMAITGDFRSWSTTPNMTLVSNNIWQADVFLETASNRFKLAANNAWGNNWGENNQPSFNPPITGTAEKFGGDITMTNAVRGYYRVIFNDATSYYRIELQTRCNYRSMWIAGTFNNWNPSVNDMVLISNNTWEITTLLTPNWDNRFKYVANGAWGTEWGEATSVVTGFPVTGTAELNPGDGKDIYLPSGPHYGNYTFTFNDSTLTYRVQPKYRTIHQSLAIVGTFNGWNPWPNMILVSNYLWKYTLSTADSAILFKIAANNGWDKQWGTTNQSCIAPPVYTYGVLTNGYGNDFLMTNIENGVYTVYFEETNYLCRIYPEGILQNFDDWKTKSTYAGEYLTNGWIVSTGIINSTSSRFGICVRLGTNSSGNYVRTPLLSNGVQALSFWYRTWDGSEPLTYLIQTSTDGINWTTNDVLYNITSTSYLKYTKDLSETNGIYIRIYHQGGEERLLIDDFLITEPYANAWINDVTTTPLQPWTNDSVTVLAQISKTRLASNLQVTLYYRMESNGLFYSIGMNASNLTFSTTNSIPKQSAGTTVSYYIAVSFVGKGSASPIYWPELGSNNPAAYSIPLNKLGAIWINELNYEPIPFITDDTNEYVELCGMAGLNLSNWRIELMDENAPFSQPYASYSIPSGSMLYLDDTNGFGFFVLGDAGMSGIEMILTNAPEGGVGQSHIKDGRGAIRILNEIGRVEYAISYGEATNNLGFQYIGAKPFDWSSDYPLALQGNGFTYTNFTWGTATVLTVHSVNQDQKLLGGNTNAPTKAIPAPTVYFTSLIGSTSLLFVTEGNTNTPPWTIVPYYATAIGGQQQWTAVSPFFSTYSGGTNTIWFSKPSGTNCFYRMLFVKP